MIRKDHLVPPTPLDAEAASLLDALEDVLGHRVKPLRLYPTHGGIVLWDPVGREITLMRPPVAQEYHSSVLTDDVNGADELDELLEERFERYEEATTA